MKLSKAEEELMSILWKQQRAFMKDLILAYPEPRPAPTTVATMLKRMTDKGFVAYTAEGRSREYYPLIQKKEYFSRHVNRLIKRFFNDSTAQFTSFFTTERNLSRAELEELKALIEEEIKKK